MPFWQLISFELAGVLLVISNELVSPCLKVDFSLMATYFLPEILNEDLDI